MDRLQQLGISWVQALEVLAPGSSSRTSMEENARVQVEACDSRGMARRFVLDGIFPESLVHAVADEVPDITGDAQGCEAGYACFRNLGSHSFVERSKNVKSSEHAMGPATRLLYGLLRSETWVSFLQHALGVEGLIPDPFLLGSGVHNTVHGGYLQLHTDFNFNEKIRLHRRVNVFLYLNEDWQEAFGGHLEIWNWNLTRREAKISPTFGRVVGFRSNDFSYHGHPHPLETPRGRSRRSVAMYYYTTSRPSSECVDGICDVVRDTSWAEVDCEGCRSRACAEACRLQVTRGRIGTLQALRWIMLKHHWAQPEDVEVNSTALTLSFKGSTIATFLLPGGQILVNPEWQPVYDLWLEEGNWLA